VLSQKSLGSQAISGSAHQQNEQQMTSKQAGLLQVFLKEASIEDLVTTKLYCDQPSSVTTTTMWRHLAFATIRVADLAIIIAQGMAVPLNGDRQFIIGGVFAGPPGMGAVVAGNTA
jgi:hypothetical protein